MSDRAAFEAQLAPLASAYVPGAVIAAAVELGLFAHLDAPRSAEELAARVDADPDGVGRLLRALVALGVASRDADGRFACAHAAALTADEPAGLGASFLHHQRHLAPLFAGLAPALRRAGRPHAAWRFAGPAPADSPYEELGRHPEEMQIFLRAMDRESREIGARIAALEDLTGGLRLLDLGGGGGAVARGLLAAVPGLTVETVDLGPACDYARRAAERAGLEARHRLTEGDVRALDEALAPADVVLLSAVLADFPPDERDRVLAQAASKVAPGGRLLISETLLDASGVAPVEATLLSLMTFAAFGGAQLELETLRGLLDRAGFAVTAHHPRGAEGRDLVVARAR